MEPRKIENPYTEVPDEQRFQRYAHDAYLGNTATKYGLAAGLPPGPEDDLDLDELEELLREKEEEE